MGGNKKSVGQYLHPGSSKCVTQLSSTRHANLSSGDGCQSALGADEAGVRAPIRESRGAPLMNLQQQMEKIYQELSPDKIPWNLEEPPQRLVEVVESKRVSPCEAVDLGCGAGNYAVWLASKGFQMTGVDISPKAIELAVQSARKRSVSCRFIVGDLLGDVGRLTLSFDFAYDWEALHHIFPKDRERYVHNVHRMLRPDGRYLSVCFSEEDPAFGGKGKYRTTPLGTTLYFSSEKELRGLFEQYFKIEELCIEEIPGKHGSHKAAIGFMTRK